MGLQCGIVGLPNVGKSTLFNALSSAKATAANFPFCTIEPNVGMVVVPDTRLDKLVELVSPQSIVPTTMEFVDIAGLVKGASKGEGLGNKFLANIREVDAIVHVVRCFEDNNIIHVENRINPVSDKEVIDTELQLKDLDTIEKRISKTERSAKSGDVKAKKEMEILTKIQETLVQGINARSVEFDAKDEDTQRLLKELSLLTQKPVIYVTNVDINSLQTGNTHTQALENAIKGENAQVVRLCASLEAEIAELGDVAERKEFLAEYGLTESGLDKLIHASYYLLNLITYFTAGVKEVRAWTIRKGWKAPQAAGVIHSDLERGFIRAEVIKYNDYVHYKTEVACKEAGKMSVEGKDYTVIDGDIMHFRHNS